MCEPGLDGPGAVSMRILGVRESLYLEKGG
jgi:hypothetical protein